MRRLWSCSLLGAVLLFGAQIAAAQVGFRYQSEVLTQGGLAFPTIRVCTEPATGTPCTPLASIFSDNGLTIPLANPFTGDAQGNYFFYALPTVRYHVQVFQNGVLLTDLPDVSLGGGVSNGGGGTTSTFVCGTTPNVPGLPYWNGTACVVDGGATFDPVNLVWNFEAIISQGPITSQGVITGAALATAGNGGILDLQLQTPPASVPTNHAYVYANSLTGLIDCLKNGLVECFGGIQALTTNSVALPTSAIASGACSSVATLTAPGATTSSHIIATPAADPTGVTGYAPSASGSVYVQAYMTTNTANFKVCNNTSSTVTPGALSLNVVVF